MPATFGDWANTGSFCGSALEPGELVVALMGGELAASPPSWMRHKVVKIDGHVSGKGAVKHREFAMASGEMCEAEFTRFLTTALGLAGAHTVPGAVIDAFMDWRHMGEMLAAGRANGFDLLNLCVCGSKTNGGMGSLYRSKHELVFVFRNGNAPHRNNIQLGRFGRNRTNVWTYAGANVRPGEQEEDPLALHPQSNQSCSWRTPDGTQPRAATWSSIHFLAVARQFWQQSAQAGEVMASSLIPSMSIPQLPAGSG